MTINIPYAAPAAPVAHGLLNTPTPDLLGPVLAALMLLAALLLMPGQLRESLRTLWAPVGRVWAGLRWPCACEGLFLVCYPFGPVEPILCAEWPSEDEPIPGEQLRRLAYPGYKLPPLT